MQQIRALIKSMLRCSLGLVILLCGCDSSHFPGEVHLAYGMEPPSAPPDPDLRLLELTYQPTKAANGGDEIVFQVTANKPIAKEFSIYGGIGLAIDNYDADGFIRAPLHDDGFSPDAIAQDEIYSGKLTIPKVQGIHYDISVIARVAWYSTAPPPTIYGEPLDILPAEGK